MRHADVGQMIYVKSENADDLIKLWKLGSCSFISEMIEAMENRTPLEVAYKGENGSAVALKIPGGSGVTNWYELKYFEETDSAKKKNSPVKTSYKPGGSISDFVKGLLKLETDENRKKWLRTFDNCVLPPTVKSMIDEAITVVLLRHKYEEWGLNEHFEKGLGNTILIYGPPGTGKTMVTESIAAVLDKNLMRISSAELQSNVPGQTERNIKDAFAKAAKNDCVVMFDECDSVLMNRDSVGAILGAEINALLTELERFPGVAVLTTNRLHRLDPALSRRIVAKVELLPPDEPTRKIIWEKLIPPKMPTQKLDYSSLAKAELTGGEIKNAILLAARKAIAKAEERVTMEHFLAAIEMVLSSSADFRERQPRRLSKKVAKNVSVGDLGEAEDVLRGTSK